MKRIRKDEMLKLINDIQVRIYKRLDKNVLKYFVKSNYSSQDYKRIKSFYKSDLRMTSLLIISLHYISSSQSVVLELDESTKISIWKGCSLKDINGILLNLNNHELKR